MYIKAILTNGINLRFSGHVLSWQSTFSNYKQNILYKRFFKMNLIYNNVYAYWKTPKINEADNLGHTTEIYLSFLNGSYLYVKYETFKMLTKTNKTLHLKHLNVIISNIYIAVSIKFSKRKPVLSFCMICIFLFIKNSIFVSHKRIFGWFW